MESVSNHPADSAVSREQVLRIAELAQLELTPEELAGMLRDLNSILGHVAQLNELDTATVPPMTQLSDILLGQPQEDSLQQSSASDSRRLLRADTPRASLDRNLVMAEAPDTDGTYFKVPKVIER